MMRVRIFNIIILIVFSTFLPAKGQAPNLILTEAQNVKWFDSLRALPLDQQLLMIKERLLVDTNVFVRQFYNDGTNVNEQLGNRVYGDGKPTIVVDGYPMIIDNKTESAKIINLTKYLTTDFIKEIMILGPNDGNAQALYGIAGRSGVILMPLTKKKHLKKFRKLRLESNGYKYT